MTSLKKDHAIQTSLLALIASILLASITLIGREFGVLSRQITEIKSATGSIYDYEIVPNGEAVKVNAVHLIKLDSAQTATEHRLGTLENFVEWRHGEEFAEYKKAFFIRANISKICKSADL